MIDPNAPAYPLLQIIPGNTGLTIRAEIASRVLQGLLANELQLKAYTMGEPRRENLSEWFAALAVSYADSLIEQLNKSKEGEK